MEFFFVGKMLVSDVVDISNAIDRKAKMASCSAQVSRLNVNISTQSHMCPLTLTVSLVPLLANCLTYNSVE